MKLFELFDEQGGDGDDWDDEGRAEFEAKMRQYLDALIKQGKPLVISNAVGDMDTLSYLPASDEWINGDRDTLPNDEMPQLMSQNDAGKLFYNY